MRTHPRAVTAQELAHSLGVSGYQVAKTVVVEADGRPYLAVLPAPDWLDLEAFARVVGAQKARLMREGEFLHFFPDCEPGAEPPFGGLYGLPVVVDESLARQKLLVLRVGSHEEAVEMSWDDFRALERPKLGSFAMSVPPSTRRPEVRAEPRP